MWSDEDGLVVGRLSGPGQIGETDGFDRPHAYLDEVGGARPALLPEQRVDDRCKEGASIVGGAEPGWI